MKSWSNNDLENFKRSMQVVLRAMLPDYPKEDSEYADDKLVEYLTAFRSATNIGEREVTQPEAVKEFQLWLLSNEVRPGQAETEYLYVSIKRVIGNEEVTLGLGSHFAIGSGAGRSVSYDRLTDAVLIEFDRYVRDRLPKQNRQPGIGQTNGQSSQQWFAATAAFLEVKTGKKYYKVKCGRWNQHGVNYWPEQMKANGQDPDKITIEGLDLTGWEALVQMEGDKAIKVLKMRRA